MIVFIDVSNIIFKRQNVSIFINFMLNVPNIISDFDDYVLIIIYI
jgi:hypothetical protein